MTSPGILAPLGERPSTRSEGDNSEPSILSGDFGVLTFQDPLQIKVKNVKGFY